MQWTHSVHSGPSLSQCKYCRVHSRTSQKNANADEYAQLALPPNVSAVYVSGGAWLRGGFITAPGAGAVTISGRASVSRAVIISLRS